jgi:ABC-type transport system involved in multi-copper enzyme maturation permease subunit
MKTILKRTLQQTLSPVWLILFAACGVLAGAAVGLGRFSTPQAYRYLLNTTLARQHLMVFFLVDGLALMVLLSAVGSGLIAAETHEGTLRLLAAKPNSRAQILTAKIVGMAAGAVLLLLLGLTAMFATEQIVGTFDGNIARDLLAYYPAYLLYGLIIIAFLGSLTTLLSTLVKKRVAALLPSLLVVLCVLGVWVVIRVAAGITGPSALSGKVLLDVNYQFALLLRCCAAPFGSIGANGGSLDGLTTLMNLFTSMPVDQDLTYSQNFGETMLTANNALNQWAVLGVYLALSAANIAGSYAVMRRKDV